VYLSRQTLDIMIALKTCAGNSRYLLPSRYDAGAPMSRATFNRVTYAVVEQAKKEGLPLEPFTVHDLRRTGSTLLNELGFNSDWIEKCLAHEDGRSSRGVYNQAEYEVQRRHMMQEWSDIVDAWVEGRKHTPVLLPPAMPLMELDQLFDRPRPSLSDIRVLGAADWRRAAREQPSLTSAKSQTMHLGESGGEIRLAAPYRKSCCLPEARSLLVVAGGLFCGPPEVLGSSFLSSSILTER